MVSAVEWIKNEWNGSGAKKETFVGGMSGGGVSPGFIAICFALFCPCIYQMINCTRYKGGWSDVGLAWLIVFIASILVTKDPALLGVGYAIFIALWVYSSFSGVQDFLCPISAPGGFGKQRGGGKRKMKGGKSKKIGGRRKY